MNPRLELIALLDGLLEATYNMGYYAGCVGNVRRDNAETLQTHYRRKQDYLKHEFIERIPDTRGEYDESDA